MNDYTEALKQADRGSYSGLRTMLNLFQPDQPSPALLQRVLTINQIRKSIPGKFVPQPNIPDPAAAAIAEMRSLVPPQAGMLLCTVPPNAGLLGAADDSRYVFWTESKYTVVIAEKRANSALLLLPAGAHTLFIAAHSAEADDPYFQSDPFHCFSHTGMLNVPAGAVTEIVPARKNNFAELTYHIVYH